MRRALIAVGLVGVLTTTAAAEESAPGAWRWSAELLAGPAAARKAMRWTGPDRATDLAGGVAGLTATATWLDGAEPGALAFRLGGEIAVASLGRRHFEPTTSLRVDELEARHAGLLLVAGIAAPGTGRRTLGIPAAVYADLAVGLIEIDVDIAFAAGGPPPIHHHDTELAVRLEAGVILGAPWWPARAPDAPWRRLSLRLAVQFLAADESVITTGAGSVGGYRPDFWAVRLGVGWAF